MDKPEYYQEGESFESQFAELIDELELLACKQSEDYSENVDDGFSICKQFQDMGGRLSTELYFNAERTRDSHRPGIEGDITQVSYQVGGTVWYHGLNFRHMSPEVQEYLLDSHIDDEDEIEVQLQRAELMEYFGDEGRELSISYKHSHTLYSDGTLRPYVSLAVHEGENEYPITEVREEGAVQDLTLTTEPELEDYCEDIDMEELGIEIDPEFKLAFTALGRQLADEYEQKQVLGRFYNQINDIRFVTNSGRLQMVKNTINQLFPTVDQDQDAA